MNAIFALNVRGKPIRLGHSAFFLAFAACASRFEVWDRPSGTSAPGVSDKKQTSSADELESFVADWP